jgi:hypothetical protein
MIKINTVTGPRLEKSSNKCKTFGEKKSIVK